MVFYCPICWAEISEEDRTRGLYGSDLAAADARPIVEKPCSLLRRLEGETAVRAAWILGERRAAGAVPELIRIVEAAKDGYVVEAAVEALGKVGDPTAIQSMNLVAEHGTIRVRIAARRALRKLSRNAVDSRIGRQE